MSSTFLRLGAALSFVAVGLGAFGTHSLARRIDAHSLEIFEKGTRYQAVHAIAILLIGVLLLQTPSKRLAAAGWAFTVGVVLFCGSLYALALTGMKAWGAVAPLGGLGFLTGWGLLFSAVGDLKALPR